MVRLSFGVLVGLLSLCPLSAFAGLVWSGDFETGSLDQWTKVERVSADRVSVVRWPVRQGKYAVKVTLKQGDKPIEASGNRDEMVHGTLQPEGSESYYRWSTMFDSSYPSENTWQVFTQWHHSGCCGSPPLGFNVVGEELVLVNWEKAIWRTPLVRNKWHDFILHVKWSWDGEVGFIELYYDGQRVLEKTKAVTGANTYLKQGLYRNDTIAADGIVYHDGMTQGTRLEDVLPPQSESSESPSPAPAPSTETTTWNPPPVTNTGSAPITQPTPSAPTSREGADPSLVGLPPDGSQTIDAMGGCSTAEGRPGVWAVALAAAGLAGLALRRRGRRNRRRRLHPR